MQTNTVFFDVVMPLDGFIDPEGMDLAHANDPEYKQWMNKWMALQQWVFQQKFFREKLNLGEGSEIGQDNRMLEETFQRTSVSIMERRCSVVFWPRFTALREHEPRYQGENEGNRPIQRGGSYQLRS